MSTQETYSPRSARPQRNPVVLILGWLCIVLGLVLFSGGIWLIALGGSWYYGIAGLGLAVTGILLIRHMVEAVWVFLVVWIGTVAWAWWEVGADWWAEVPRLIAPTMVFLLVLLCIPALHRRK